MEDHETKIREHAYDLWIAEGCPAGMDYQHWMQAWHDLHGASRSFAVAGSSALVTAVRTSTLETLRQDMRQSAA